MSAHMRRMFYSPDCYWSGVCGYITGRCPKAAGSLLSMIFLIPDRLFNGGFLIQNGGKMKNKICAIMLVVSSILIYDADALTLTCSDCNLDYMPSECESMCHSASLAMGPCIANSITGEKTCPAPNTDYGVYVYETQTYVETCGKDQGSGLILMGSCHVETEEHYICGRGYYGTATSATTGCKKCRDPNACSGGNDTTDTSCYSGWYRIGGKCVRCPLPETGPTDEGNYMLHSDTGATSASGCYLDVTSIVTDKTGQYEVYNDRCYYTE